MRAVAKRRVPGVLAAAQPDHFLLCDPELDWGKLRALVAAVAERLMLRTAAAAPPVGFICFDFNLNGLSTGEAGLWSGVFGVCN